MDSDKKKESQGVEGELPPGAAVLRGRIQPVDSLVVAERQQLGRLLLLHRLLETESSIESGSEAGGEHEPEGIDVALCFAPLAAADAGQHACDTEASLEDGDTKRARASVAGVGHVGEAAGQDQVVVAQEAAEEASEEKVGDVQLQVHDQEVDGRLHGHAHRRQDERRPPTHTVAPWPEERHGEEPHEEAAEVDVEIPAGNQRFHLLQHKHNP